MTDRSKHSSTEPETRRHTEAWPTKAKRANTEWLRYWLADPDLTDRGKLLAVVLSEFGDWDTGENVHPMQATMAAGLGWTERKVRRALADLEGDGAIEPTGHLRFGVVIYRRLTPASPDTGDRTTPDTGDRTTDSQSGHFGSPVRTDWVSSPDTGVLHTSSTDSYQEEGEEETRSLNRAERSSLAALDADEAATLLADVLPPTFGGVDTADPKLLGLLAKWEEDGRDDVALRNVCAPLGTRTKPVANPTMLLATYIRNALRRPVPRPMPAADPVGQGQDTQPAATKAKTAKQKTKTTPAKTKTAIDRDAVLAEFGERAPGVVEEMTEAGVSVSVATDDAGRPRLSASGDGWEVLWMKSAFPMLRAGDEVRAAVLAGTPACSEYRNGSAPPSVIAEALPWADAFGLLTGLALQATAAMAVA